MHPLRALVRQLTRSWHKHGPVGSLQMAARYVAQRIRESSPARRRARRSERAYDAAYGIDTGGVVALGALRVNSENWYFGNRYQPIGFDAFQTALQSLAIAHERFAFVDLGSGKGRALLLASHHPFRSVVGVEFAPELHAIAEQNIRNYRHPDRRCWDVRVHCADAAAYELPPGPLVLFLYNSFGPEVLRPVLQNLRSSSIAAPRPIYLIYCNPEHAAVVDEATWLERVVSTRDYVIWRTTEEGSAHTGGTAPSVGRS